MTTPRIEEILEENRVIVHGRGYIPVKVALEIHDIAHQAGIDEAVEKLREMKKKDLPSSLKDPVGFCKGFGYNQALDDTIKALQDNK